MGADSYTPAVYTFDVGLAYLILPNVQLDAGANFGLTKSSPNLDIYTCGVLRKSRGRKTHGRESCGEKHSGTDCAHGLFFRYTINTIG